MGGVECEYMQVSINVCAGGGKLSLIITGILGGGGDSNCSHPPRDSEIHTSTPIHSLAIPKLQLLWDIQGIEYPSDLLVQKRENLCFY